MSPMDRGERKTGGDIETLDTLPRLVGADFIHPMPGGAKIVGELLYNALRDGFNDYKLRQLKERPGALAEAPGPSKEDAAHEETTKPGELTK